MILRCCFVLFVLLVQFTALTYCVMSFDFVNTGDVFVLLFVLNFGLFGIVLVGLRLLYCLL